MAQQRARRRGVDPITVDLEIDQTRTLLELDGTEDRAFSIGASAHADVRICRGRVPAVAFYLERRGDEVWLVPGYRRGALAVNGVGVSAPFRLARRAVIDVSGVQAFLEVGSHSTSPAPESEADDPKTEISEATRRSRLAYLESLPDLDDCTLIGDRSARDSRALHRTPSDAARSASHSALRRLGPPHLWTLLAQRPFETLGFVLLVGALMLISAVISALFLRG